MTLLCVASGATNLAAWKTPFFCKFDCQSCGSLQLRSIAAEVVGGTTPWIKITQDMSETDVKMGDQLVFEATVKDPLGQSDTDSITLDVVGQPIKVWKHSLTTPQIPQAKESPKRSTL